MSKELEALEKIKNIKTVSVPERRVVTFQEKYKEELDIIETALHEKNNLERKLEEYALALKEKNKSEKALKIIKEKEVDVESFLYACTCPLETLVEQHQVGSNYELARECVGCDKESLTLSEYYLLKEVLL